MKGSPTSHDVARLADVSRATVSAVINKSKFVSIDLERRVLAAVGELGYRPNGIARSLKTRRTMAVGLLTPSIATQVPFIQTVENRLITIGYQLVLGHTGEDPQRELRVLEMLLERRVDALLVIPTGDVNRERFAAVVQSGTPLVFFDRTTAGGETDSVISDNFTGAYEAVCHLLDIHHRRVAVLAKAGAPSSIRDRVAGYRQALRDHGIVADERLCRRGPSLETLETAALALLDGPEPPNALFTAEHSSLLGALRAAQRLGVRIPQELALISFDDSPWLPFLTCPLTVVQQDVPSMVETVVEYILQRITRAYMGPPRQYLVPTRLIVRASCGCGELSMTDVAPPSIKADPL